ncbi:MAG: hypothetical protein AAGF58_07380 [Pseudomonadota bacterium]
MKLIAFLITLISPVAVAFAHADPVPHTHGPDGSIVWLSAIAALIVLGIAVRRK